MSAPGGLERLIATAGDGDAGAHLRRRAATVDLDALRAAAAELDVTFA